MSVVSYQVEAGIAVLTIDYPPVNALGHDVRVGMMEAVKRAGADTAATAIVVIGAKGTFIAGADIREFGKPHLPPTVYEVQAVLESSAKPVVAGIEGNALGGGLEIALTCHYRVATPKAKVGLPEVKLGLLPGAGGTQRLTRLTGPEVAIDLITSGRHIDAKTARDLGVVDELVDDARTGAIAFAQRVVAEKRPLRKIGEMNDKVRGIDPALFASARKKLERKAKGQVAPWKIVDCIEAACRTSIEEGLKFEREAFQACLNSPQREALIHIFFAEREAKKIPGIPPDLKPLPIRSAAVVGAGTMGGGIAMCFANAGIPVTLLDMSAEAVARGREKVEKNYATSVSRGSLSQPAMDRALGLIQPASDYAAVAGADIVIEAVFEDMAVKQEVFRRLDSAAKQGAILTTNTSSLDIDQIAAVTSRPDMVIGTHFFSPANVMKLLENVRGAKTSPEVIATAMALGKILGKIPVLAGNCDGFIGNRMLKSYTLERDFLLEDGASPQQIDAAVEEFGFAMGPAAVGDLAGNDVGWKVRQARASQLPKGDRQSSILRRLYEAGRYGQKTGRGFYRYEGRTPVPDPEVDAMIRLAAEEAGIQRRSIDAEEIVRRLLYPMVNEGARILEEGIALRSGDIDIVYVYGYGFPAHRGGPMFWGEKAGLDKIYAQMVGMAKTHGPSWTPAPLLERLAKSGKGWSAAAEKV